jgi:NADH:ubiquinone oxidoreductase subunit 4 (subunit M)
MCFWIGLYPKPFFDILDKPVARLVQQLEQRPQTGVAEVFPAPSMPQQETR